MTNARRGVMVLGLVVAVFIAWLSWAWPPSVDEEPIGDDAGRASDSAPVPSSAVLQHAPLAKVEAPPPKPAEPAEPAAAAPEVPPVEPPEPERIPTPHPMSLDQTKPPEEAGPLAELKNRYASESRSAESSATEAKLRTLISEARNVPSELVQGISCRRSICKIEMHWTARRRIGFAVVFGSFKQMYNQRVAVEPPSARAEDGTYLTTLYLQFSP